MKYDQKYKNNVIYMTLSSTSVTNHYYIKLSQNNGQVLNIIPIPKKGDISL